MSKTYNNRERSDRYQGNRSYIYRPGGVEWWRGAFALTAIVVSVWFAWHFGFSAEARDKGFHSSRGELTYKHSAWNDRCDACHVTAENMPTEHRDLWDINGRWTEFTCRHCHSGPPHHTYSKIEDQQFDKNCAACHHDHSGKEYSLVRIADTHCTRCHSELKTHPNKFGNNDNYAEKITHFGTEQGHPQFSALTKEYKRTLKFSHALHMAPGIFVNNKPANPTDVWSVEKIKEIEKTKQADRAASGVDAKDGTLFSYVERYAQFETSGKMGEGVSYTQLTCFACHELDSGRESRFPREFKDPENPSKVRVTNGWNGTDKIVPEAPKENLLPARAEGAYYLPVNFEKHCQACHPIGISLKSRDNHEVRLELPHRKQLGDFDATLYDRVTRIFLTKATGATGDLPRRLDRPLFPLSQEGEGALKKELDDARSKLFDPSKGKVNDAIRTTAERGELAIKTSGSTCQKCHTVTQNPETKALFVEPGNTPSVWFEHSKFSHVGHRAMNCVECHKSYASGAQYDPSSGALKWDDPEQWNQPGSNVKPPKVDIAGVEDCQKCHAPAQEKDGVRFGGVRHDCTDCHRYHNAEFPLQGMGAINRDPGYEAATATPDLNPSKDKRRDPTTRFDWRLLLDGLPPGAKKPQ